NSTGSHCCSQQERPCSIGHNRSYFFSFLLFSTWLKSEMMKNIILAAAVVLSTYTADHFDCDKNGKCGPGLTCEDGMCVLRTDCPILSMPRLKAGCELELEVDERDCPRMKIICEDENLS
ncbi:hypothetical protein ANCCAN_05181, partial [Ancylostoma caninum]